jgi:SEC-C motif-containing protein
MAPDPRDCPCHSGLRYNVCCRPLHSGEAAAARPETLMRSRYSAFALGLGSYLVETLAATHPDRSRPPAELARELGQAHRTQRYMGLTIFSARPDEVLFHARIFVQGRDHSFVELSSFVLEAGGWRYAAGDLLPASVFGSALAGLTRDTFRTHLKSAAAPAPPGPTQPR